MEWQMTNGEVNVQEGKGILLLRFKSRLWATWENVFSNQLERQITQILRFLKFE
jgi:hypothetical protein